MKDDIPQRVAVSDKISNPPDQIDEGSGLIL
jgi:hypothetical protein